MEIIDYIPKGKRNAISVNRLSELVGKDKREISRLIMTARKNGEVILTEATGGYWKPDYNDPDIKEQLLSFIQFMLSKNTFSTVRSAQKALTAIENQRQIQIEDI